MPLDHRRAPTPAPAPTSTPPTTQPPASPSWMPRGVMELCPHCGRRCRVTVSSSMPSIVRCAYANAGWSTMATCESGSLEEYRLLRASYADVIAERELRAHEGVAAATAAEAQAARTLLEAAELRRWARSVRDTAVGFRARLDQMQAMLRDNEAPPPSMPGPTGST